MVLAIYADDRFVTTVNGETTREVCIGRGLKLRMLSQVDDYFSNIHLITVIPIDSKSFI